MNVPPILMLALGATFGVAYGLIITVGWAMTRKNRRKYHLSFGIDNICLFDLNKMIPLKDTVETISLAKNYFTDLSGEIINVKDYIPYIVGKTSLQYPKIEKGNLILTKPGSFEIKYVFKIPDLSNYR